MQKKLPSSDETREAALTIGKNRKDGVDPADNAFSVANSAALDVHQPLFISIRGNMRSVEEVSHNNVKNLNEALEKLKNLASHGLQIANFMIINGKPGWVEGNRTFYDSPLDGHLPDMGSQREIIQMAINFINGETARIAAGGIALKDITKADVVAQLAVVNAILVLLQDSKDAIIEANKELVDERKLVDALIPLLWNDVDHKAQTLSPGARHEFGILWGVQYKNTKGFGIINVGVEDIDTHEKLAGINLRYGTMNGKDGTKAITNLHGEAILESHNLKVAFLVATNILYVTGTRELKLFAGDEITIVIKLKKKVVE